MPFRVKDDFNSTDKIFSVPASWYNAVGRFLNTLCVENGRAYFKKPVHPSEIEPVTLVFPPAPYSAPQAWEVKWSEADESYIVYIPEGSARIFLADTPDPNLVAGEVTIGLASADVGGDWYIFDGSIGDVWASISDGEIIVSMAADSAKGALIAEIKELDVVQIARSPLEFFISADDPDAPAVAPPDPASCPNQNVHPGDADYDGGVADPADETHPGDTTPADEEAHPGDGEADSDDSDHPAALDCYTTT
jgi:hypothetical protein